MADYELRVDHELCSGTGVCMVYGPNTFEMSDDTKSVVKDPPHDDIAVIRAAVESCPNNAIILIEKD